MSNYIIPFLLLALFIFGLFKKQNIYDDFVSGAKEGLSLSVTIFPYILAIFILTELMMAAGLVEFFEKIFSPFLNVLGIPQGIFPLIFFRPFSGSGSVAILEDIFGKFGVDSFEGRCASVISGASETIFYLSALYFASNGVKKMNKSIIISLISSFFGIVVSCLLCRVL